MKKTIALLILTVGLVGCGVEPEPQYASGIFSFSKLSDKEIIKEYGYPDNSLINAYMPVNPQTSTPAKELKQSDIQWDFVAPPPYKDAHDYAIQAIQNSVESRLKGHTDDPFYQNVIFLSYQMNYSNNQQSFKIDSQGKLILHNITAEDALLFLAANMQEKDEENRQQLKKFEDLFHAEIARHKKDLDQSLESIHKIQKSLSKIHCPSTLTAHQRQQLDKTQIEMNSSANLANQILSKDHK